MNRDHCCAVTNGTLHTILEKAESLYHGVCGAFGTLAAGLFNEAGFSLAVVGVQLLGMGTAFVWACGMGFIIFTLVAMTIGLRVSPEDEMQGLDLSEHRAEAYPNFALLHPSGIGSSEQRVSPPTPLIYQPEQRR